MKLAQYFPSKGAKLSGKVPLRLILVVPFVVQIFAAVGITGWLSLRTGQKSVNDVATQLRSEITARIEQNLRTYLATPHQINQSNASAMSLGQLNVRDMAGWERHFWQQIQIFPSVTAIGIGNEQKEFILVEKPGDSSLVIIASDESTGYNINTYATNSQAQRLKLLNSTKNYDPRTRHFYKAAVAAGKPTWTKVYRHIAEPTLILSAVQPVLAKNGTLEGVLVSSLRLAEFGNFLHALKIGKTGQTFIMERTGMLVATSTTEKPFRNHNSKEERLLATESSDALTQATARYLSAYFGDFSKIQTSPQLEFQIEGKRQFLQVMPVRDGKGLDWLIVVVIPESDFMEQIDANTRTTIILCLLTAAVAILAGILTARWITQPILQLKDAATALADGRFDSEVPLDREDELGILAVAFHRMAVQLRDSFEQLETRVRSRTAELQQSETREREKALQLENTLQELQRTQSMMIQAEKMSSLGQLVAGVAHEINNPVNFIHGNLSYTNKYTQNLLALLQLYQKHCPNPAPEIQDAVEEMDLEFLAEDLPKTLASMKIGTERIRQIVLSLRNFSRLDEADKKRVDIHEGIDSTLLILQSRLQAVGVAGKMPVPQKRSAIQVIKEYGNLPVVECYAGQLNQVFMNLLSNAIDALESEMEKGHLPSPAIRIRTAVTDRRIEILIADNGPGMTEEVRRKIFDPFFTTKPVGKGTGLGLSISYQIVVEKHGGQLQCISAPGEGAEFAISIPLRPIKS